MYMPHAFSSNADGSAPVLISASLGARVMISEEYHVWCWLAEGRYRLAANTSVCRWEIDNRQLQRQLHSDRYTTEAATQTATVTVD